MVFNIVFCFCSVDSEFSGGFEKYKIRVIIDYDGINVWYSLVLF